MEGVDAVVTWVDSSCPLWQEARKRHAADEPDYSFSTPQAPDAEVDLCLSLLVEFLPWLRRIWLVTMRPQRPQCLSREEFRGKVHVVHHDEIFEHASHLPSFSSHAIEANLWRIPGLCEKFIYLNDDMYVLQPLAESVFFQSELPLAWLSKAIPRCWAQHSTGYHRGWTNLSEILPGTRLLHHFPCALTKSSLHMAAARFPDWWSQTCEARVRTVRDLPPIGTAVNLGVAEERHVGKKLPKTLMRGAILKPMTVQSLVGRDLCFLCVNRQPFDKTRLLCDSVRSCFLKKMTGVN